jgi:hypothetical protein
MPRKPATPPPSAAPRPQWRPLPEAWREFAERHPELFVGLAPSARSRFVSRHGEALRAAGALLRAPSGMYYADAERFDALAYRLVMGLPLAEGVAA